MESFITVHHYSNNQPIYIRPELILVIDPYTDIQATKIHIGSSGYVMAVSETADEVMTKIHGGSLGYTAQDSGTSAEVTATMNTTPQTTQPDRPQQPTQSEPVVKSVEDDLPKDGQYVCHCFNGVRGWQWGPYLGGKFFIAGAQGSEPATHWFIAPNLPSVN